MTLGSQTDKGNPANFGSPGLERYSHGSVICVVPQRRLTHLLPSSKGKVTIVVSPLISLHDEQVETFESEFGLCATAINSAHSGCTKEVMSGVVSGAWQIVMISPEMLLSRRFIDCVLRKPEFGSRCLSVFIDEAHCVSHWGASFRKKYGTLGIVRAFLLRAVPIVAVSAMLTQHVHDDLLNKLQFDENNYLFVNIGNDRPAVSQVIRAIEHPMNTYRDLNFLVPEGIKTPTDIKKAFVYSDDTQDGGWITDHLNDRVPETFVKLGLVRPYNATLSKKYRCEVMRVFKAGIVHILVCTDAAGMGCNIPDVDVIVQWKAPANLSSWVQRAGRAARAAGRTGMAVMLVEKSAFEVNQGPIVEDSNLVEAVSSMPQGRGGRGGHGGHGGRGGRGGCGGRGRGHGAKHGSGYAVSHGQKRGTYGGAHDQPPVVNTPQHVANDAPGEGLYALIQATTCRRKILSTVFRNPPSAGVPPHECCDICHPSLFGRTRPSKPVAAARMQSIKKGEPVEAVRLALYQWRRTVKKTRYPAAMFAPHAILDDKACDLLASIGPVETRQQLEPVLLGWARWEELGDDLFHTMNKLVIPSLAPKKRGTAAKKHLAAELPIDAPIVQLNCWNIERPARSYF
ncbi:putative ATP-dependent DNA helicase RecQ [Hypsizygus marmoreus]|uniref:DNA 3'-5' helicase n=1 Tax=Hypsizygus marmoreus TaxID=39966 RepID=A0A369J3M8_HYPMA|nr:putative ATP-dependent DNA helicase RecQ [Hypsizygus marmoreus]